MRNAWKDAKSVQPLKTVNNVIHQNSPIKMELASYNVIFKMENTLIK